MYKSGEKSKSVRIRDLEKQVERLSLQLSDYDTVKEQLAQAQKREILASLSGGIAHDFNNILHCILGYTEMAIVRKRNGSVDVGILQQIQSIVKKGRDLTQQFLVFGRETSHQKVELNFNTVIEEVKLLLLRTIPRNIAIEHKLEASLSTIKGDVGQCEQVVMNLCINAMDAMPDGGRLLIETQNRHVTQSSNLHRRLGIQPGSYVQVTVTDNGTGMSDQVVENIFEPFFTTKQKDKGSGLGLSVVSSIVKGHGGYIECTSMLGSGTTFDIYLPIAQGDSKQITVTEDKCFLGNGRGGEVILFVDDEEEVMEIGKHFLEESGYTVLTAGDCEKALDIFHSTAVDLVVMDVGLPGMGGAEFLRRLQAVNSALKVLVISGYHASSDTIRALELKENEFLQKPFSFEDLTKRVRTLFDGSTITIAPMVYQDDLRA